MSVTIPGRFDSLHTALEEQFEETTATLTALLAASDDPERGGYDRDTHATLLASARQSLADTTEALRRMADGSYGLCQRCQREIPVERLEIRPHARFCVPCQRS